MKHLSILLISVAMFIGCQTDDSSYDVLTKSRTIDKGDCKVPVDYPQIIWRSDRDNHSEINEILERLPEHEYYARNCSSENPQLVSGRFEVLLKTDRILCIEYQTHITYRNERRTVFHSLVIDPANDASLTFAEFIIAPGDLIPNFDRGRILPHIERYNLERKSNINTLAYQTGSNYAITWGISEQNFIIYPGGEGEGFGYDKIEIPLDEFK